MADLRQAEPGSLADVIAKYFQCVDRGEEIDAAGFLAEHPHLADELCEFFATAEAIERMAGPADAEALQSSETLLQPPLLAPPARVPSGLVVPSEFGRYRILRVIGHGGMGTVYLAHDRTLQRDVALKIPRFFGEESEELISRFYREARAAATLEHPDICPVYDVGEIDGTRYISMAYLEGQPLSAWIREGRLPPPISSAKLIRLVAGALAQAHAHGIVHRDIKPANIMITDKRRPVLMDFGLALRVAADKEASQLTCEGTVLGTPAYMSPEQADGHTADVGPASDIYSLGVVLYELLTGRVPFLGPVAAVLAQIVRDDPVPPTELREGIDPRLESICLRMMARRIEDRYPDMAAVVEALTDYIRNSDAQLTPPPIAAEESSAIRRIRKPHWARFTAISVGVAAICLTAGLLFLNRERSGEPPENQATAASTSPATAPSPTGDQPARPEAERLQQEWARRLGVPVEYTNSLGMTFRLIPPGDFVMGSPQEELDEVLATDPPDHEKWRYELEAPQQSVQISEPFFLGAHEVTLGLFREFVTQSGFQTYGENAGEGAERYVDGRNQTRPEWIWSHEELALSDVHPVVAVAIEDAHAFCRWLSEREGLEYAVPSSAQWEYACRAGTTTRWHCGDDPEVLLDYAWYRPQERGPHPVGQKRPNGFGLFDMHGNVMEWVHSETRSHVWPDCARGGNNAVDPIRCRSACIFSLRSTTMYQDLGFRVAILGDLSGTRPAASPGRISDQPRSLVRVRALTELGRWDEAAAAIQEAEAPGVARGPEWNKLAWRLVASGPIAPEQARFAVLAAERAVACRPGTGQFENTLGVARYRAGDWAGALEALEESLEVLDTRSLAYNAFFLAMVHHQLRETDEARQWYQRAVAWTEANEPDNEDLRRFQAEAEALLGLSSRPPLPPDHSPAEAAR